MLTSLIQANPHKIIYPHNPNTSEEEMITENLPSSLLIFVIFNFFSTSNISSSFSGY